MSRCLRATCLVVAVAVAGGVTAIQAAGRRLGPFYVDFVFMVVHKHVYVHSHLGGRGGQ